MVITPRARERAKNRKHVARIVPSTALHNFWVEIFPYGNSTRSIIVYEGLEKSCQELIDTYHKLGYTQTKKQGLF